MRQEFRDHYHVECGIISQFMLPFTLQHNGVSERRNRILLDMVRSMMKLTNLLLSFWGYALESVARILNMVLKNKVEKTPYEIWHKTVTKLSYLKVWGCDALVKCTTLANMEEASPNNREVHAPSNHEDNLYLLRMCFEYLVESLMNLGDMVI
nr:retrotransposon protein, putative, Ty1-copia subclass [Tanacetum cinerariifolium]